jgi:hypothetical protein
MSALYNYGIATSPQVFLPMPLLAMTWLFKPTFPTEHHLPPRPPTTTAKKILTTRPPDCSYNHEMTIGLCNVIIAWRRVVGDNTNNGVNDNFFSILSANSQLKTATANSLTTAAVVAAVE